MISPWSHARLELNRPVAPKDWGPPSPRVPKFVSPAHALSPKSAWSSPASSYLRRKSLFFKMQIPPFFGNLLQSKICLTKKMQQHGAIAMPPKLSDKRYTFRSKLWPLQFCPVACGRRRSVNQFFSYVLSHGLREGHIWCSSIQTFFVCICWYM